MTYYLKVVKYHSFAHAKFKEKIMAYEWPEELVDLNMRATIRDAQPSSHLPAELSVVPESTAVVGDIDAFITYLESGQALRDWHARCAALAEE